MRALIILVVAAIAGSGLYWFDPRIEADRASTHLIDDASRAVRGAQQAVVRYGLHSRAAGAALAAATRTMFISNCVQQKFQYNQTTLTDFHAIEVRCDADLADMDRLAQQASGVDYGWDPAP